MERIQPISNNQGNYMRDLRPEEHYYLMVATMETYNAKKELFRTLAKFKPDGTTKEKFVRSLAVIEDRCSADTAEIVVNLRTKRCYFSVQKWFNKGCDQIEHSGKIFSGLWLIVGLIYFLLIALVVKPHPGIYNLLIALPTIPIIVGVNVGYVVSRHAKLCRKAFIKYLSLETDFSTRENEENEDGQTEDGPDMNDPDVVCIDTFFMPMDKLYKMK